MIQLNEVALTNFKKYLKLPTVHPNDNYNDCIKFLYNIATAMNLTVSAVNIRPNTPVFVATWTGRKPKLPSVLLLSHMDVAPVNPEEWTEDPFGGQTKDGKIYGRGAQDMKCIGIQYLEAIRNLISDSKTCLRNIHVCFLPEGGVGCQAMASFIDTNEFLSMKVGVCLDAGRASATDDFLLFTSDKICWQFTVHCRGSLCHNSLLIAHTPGEQLAYIMKKAHEFRQQQANIIQEGNTLEGVVVINCTKVGGGNNQQMYLPRELTATFNCLIPWSHDLNMFEEILNGWCRGAGMGCTLEFHIKQLPTPETKLEIDNTFWIAFRDAVEGMNLKLKIHNGLNCSDSCYLRIRGIPCFNFSPIIKTPFLSQGPDEHLGVQTFMEGIIIYANIIHKLANVP
ncbi:hypothetical protein WA026_005688 [Henosepilachna vigintioctopunctata]|uniref:N-acyl-aliphatic-L-amino acid amidohydrolase n=1 Tax=Henosepilachna vigintioctopunctata TaxID=420089 RepID=A0AAW1U679_9CUCU